MILDEKGFVFLVDGLPYYIRIWGGEPWVFYWHSDKRWVSLKRVNQTDIFLASHNRISDEEAEMYHKTNEQAS